MDSVSSCDKGNDDNTANTVSSSINMNNIETEGTIIISSIVRPCDPDVAHENTTDNLDFSQNSVIELNFRKNELLWQSIFNVVVNNDVWCQITVNCYCYKGHNQL